MTKEEAKIIAPKVLLSAYKDNINAVECILKANNQMRKGKKKGTLTIIDALKGIEEFVQELIDILEE